MEEFKNENFIENFEEEISQSDKETHQEIEEITGKKFEDENTSIQITIPNVKSRKMKRNILIIGLVVVIVVFLMVTSSSVSKNTYKQNVDDVITEMFTGAVESETVCNSICSIWYNTIYEKSDPKTNKYTLTEYYKDRYEESYDVPDYCFNEDFNDSLSSYFKSSEYYVSSLTIEGSQQKVEGLMKKLSNVPKGMEDTYKVVEELYEQFLGITRCALNPSGNFTSYSSSFRAYDNEFADIYDKARLYTE